MEKDEAEFYCNRLRNKPTHYCKICTKAAMLAWNEKHPEKSKARELRYRESHRKQIAGRTAAWYLKNKERNHRNTARWYAKNKDKGAAKSAKYRLTQKLATPVWANRIAMGEMYSLAAIKTKLTMEPWHVDHIVPLKSKLVCGLHTHYNLQVIKGSENSSKNNRIWPDMP